ncbi:hypothetical protein H4219_000979 [Mycoemilia scoparia]|uniref:PH domain-containing protein n=1 Tax=Mycoemilia scoparia TaxID=417184 RepID=A0A9W8DQX2_9FUNG|nr:hypothetical protein H4219_000979 [Mycoemilia scoparia]
MPSDDIPALPDVSLCENFQPSSIKDVTLCSSALKAFRTGDVSKIRALLPHWEMDSTESKEGDGEAKADQPRASLINMSPLQMAVLLSSPETVTELLNDFSDQINHKDRNGMTALHFAAKSGRATIATILLENGSDFQIADSNGNLPIAYASNSEVRSILKAYHDKAEFELSKQLLNWAKQGDKDSISKFITSPTSPIFPNVKTIDYSTGKTLLHYAVIMDHIDFAKWAIRHGANPNALDNDGKKPSDLGPSASMKFLLDQVPSQELNYGDIEKAPTFSGELLKWTNYANGWKPRWFELERGVLSYFKHKDDAENACRGAVNLKIAEINYNQKNPRQFDIRGKGFKRCRVKATNEKIAREWVHQLNLSKEWAKDQPEFAFDDASNHTSNNGIPANYSLTNQSVISDDNGPQPEQQSTNTGSPSAHKSSPVLTAQRPVSPSPSGNSVNSATNYRPSLEMLQVASNNMKNQLHLQSFLMKSLIQELKRVGDKDPQLQNTIAEYSETATKSCSDISQQLEELEQLISTNQKVWQNRLKAEQERIDFLADILQVQEMESAAKVDTLTKKKKSSVAKTPKFPKSIENSRPASPQGSSKNEASSDQQEASVSGAVAKFEQNQINESPDREDDNSSIDSEEESDSDEFADANDVFFDAASTLVRKPSFTPAPTAPGSSNISVSHEDVSEGTQETEKQSDLILLDGYPFPPNLRLAFPESGSKKPNLNLWQMIKSAVGKDLTKISVPVFFNEPTSFLQRFTEDMEYSTLLDIASCLPASVDRTLYVAAFAMSNYSSTFGRVAKPFNPLLGETYEYVRTDKRYRAFSEQVSHHPPVSACWVEGDNYIYHADTNVKSRFGGKSLSVVPTGGCHVYLRVPIQFKDDPDDDKLAKPKQEASVDEKGEYFTEHYSWNKITTYVQGIITGSFWIEHIGEIEVINHRTGDVTRLDFKASSWLGSGKYKVEGQALDRIGNVAYNITGKWTERIVAIPTKSGGEYNDDVMSPEAPAFARSSSYIGSKDGKGLAGSQVMPAEGLQLPNEPFVLWKVHEPSKVPIPYNLTKYAATLSDMPSELVEFLCPTDSRFRPDQRAMEKGEFNEADSKKTYLEEKQRAVRRRREAGELPSWKPRWFERSVDKDTGEGYWKFTGEYWEERERVANIKKEGKEAEWVEVPNIF